MNPTVALTLAVVCTLYTAATAASLSRDDADLMLPLTDDLELGSRMDKLNQLLFILGANDGYKSELKRASGCKDFGACAQLSLGQNALTRIRAGDSSRFGSGGPGKRRRSVDAVEGYKA